MMGHMLVPALQRQARFWDRRASELITPAAVAFAKMRARRFRDQIESIRNQEAFEHAPQKLVGSRATLDVNRKE